MAKEKIKNKTFTGIINKSVDFIFSKDNKKWVLLFFIIGFIIRTLASLKYRFCADAMVHGTHALGFIESGKLQIMDQDAVWFFLTDLSMKIFGANMFGIRFLSVLFGSLTIILVYLLGKELFNEKTGLIASFIFMISPFQILHMQALMDVPMSFFALFSMYLLILSLKENKNIFFILSWISLGIAIMIKQIALVFIPAFVLFYLYYNFKHYRKFKFKKIFLAVLIIIFIRRRI